MNADTTRTGSPGAEVPLERTARKRVLVVDDNVDTAESVAMLLALEGHETRVALSGAEACSIAASFAPQLALIETWLPDMDGCEVIRTLRASPATAAATLIAITVHGDVEARERAAAAGCDKQLVKPLDPNQLGRILRHSAS